MNGTALADPKPVPRPERTCPRCYTQPTSNHNCRLCGGTGHFEIGGG